VDAAVASTRATQSRRISQQSGFLAVGADRYESTDASQAEHVAESM
jgi:hypothetical protein